MPLYRIIQKGMTSLQEEREVYIRCETDVQARAEAMRTVLLQRVETIPILEGLPSDPGPVLEDDAMELAIDDDPEENVDPDR